MDSNTIRKYKRLDTIKENFKAYVPFWYQFGHAANEIALDYSRSEATRNEYHKKAVQCFDAYIRLNDKNLLREDQMSSACALEYIELLDNKKDRKQIEELIKVAVKHSGNANDVLQLCALSYLKIEKRTKQ